jgi:uncharacterized membrane-anchored protein
MTTETRSGIVRVALAVAIAVPLLTTAAVADAPCLEDAARLCPGVSAKEGRLWACMVRNQSQLSSACQENVRDVKRRAAEFNADCAGDVYRFCPGTRAGKGRLLECLSPYVGRRELSTSCEEAVTTALATWQAFADGCNDDAARLCAGVEPGGARLLLCLRSQSDQLSSRCRSVVNPR